MAGRKAKDRVVSEGFNRKKKGGMSKAEERMAKRQAMLEKQQADLEARKLEGEVIETAGKLEVAKAKLGIGSAPVPPAGDDDEKAAYQMLADMRWVYGQVLGRDKLKRLVKDDDKQFVFMVRELIRIESALMTARIKAKDDAAGAQQTVFVVLKGLDTEASVGQTGPVLRDVLNLEGEKVPQIAAGDERRPEDG